MKVCIFCTFNFSRLLLKKQLVQIRFVWLVHQNKSVFSNMMGKKTNNPTASQSGLRSRQPDDGTQFVNSGVLDGTVSERTIDDNVHGAGVITEASNKKGTISQGMKFGIFSIGVCMIGLFAMIAMSGAGNSISAKTDKITNGVVEHTTQFLVEHSGSEGASFYQDGDSGANQNEYFGFNQYGYYGRQPKASPAASCSGTTWIAIASVAGVLVTITGVLCCLPPGYCKKGSTESDDLLGGKTNKDSEEPKNPEQSKNPEKIQNSQKIQKDTPNCGTESCTDNQFCSTDKTCVSKIPLGEECSPGATQSREPRHLFEEQQ